MIQQFLTALNQWGMTGKTAAEVHRRHKVEVAVRLLVSAVRSRFLHRHRPHIEPYVSHAVTMATLGSGRNGPRMKLPLRKRCSTLLISQITTLWSAERSGEPGILSRRKIARGDPHQKSQPQFAKARSIPYGFVNLPPRWRQSRSRTWECRDKFAEWRNEDVSQNSHCRCTRNRLQHARFRCHGILGGKGCRHEEV